MLTSKEMGTSKEKKKPHSTSQTQMDAEKQALLQAEANVRQEEDRNRAETVIRLAKRNQWAKMRNLDFIILKTYLREVDKYGNTALYYAAINQNFEMCQRLLEKGANPNVMCELKNTPFHCAFINGSKQVTLD